MSDTNVTKTTEKHSNGDKDAVLKTNYISMAKRYELAERVIWSQLDKWKKQVIIHCKLTGTKYANFQGGAKDDRILTEYAQAIIQLAEIQANSQILAGDKLPPVPAYTLESESATNRAQST